MRADRLVALLLFLQHRGKVTAAQVAEELEVSVATARRDLEALSAAGVPVYVQPGRGGGWQLVGGARTNLTGLSGFEARALFWMLGTAGLSDPGTRVATRKLIRALPETLRAEAETLATSIHYDHSAWGEERAEDSNDLDELRTALVRRAGITALYTRRDGSVSRQSLWPLGLVAKAGTWYLVAETRPAAQTTAEDIDEPRGRRGARTLEPEVRTYRVDRLRDIEAMSEPADPRPFVRGSPAEAPHRDSPAMEPLEFDLAEYWREHVEQVEALRSGVKATVRAPTWAIPILRSHFGRYLSVQSADDEFAIAEVRANLVIALAEQLAGWGSTIEVIEPPELRRELARIGAELVLRYGQEN